MLSLSPVCPFIFSIIALLLGSGIFHLSGYPPWIILSGAITTGASLLVFVPARDVLELTPNRFRNRLIFGLLEDRFILLRALMENVLLKQVDRCATKLAGRYTVLLIPVTFIQSI